MSLRAQRCSKHPSHLVTGVCSLCLKERLSVLADVKCVSDSNQNFISGKHSLSARSSVATRDLHRQAVRHHGPSCNSFTGGSFVHGSSLPSTSVLTKDSPGNGPQCSTSQSTIKKDVKIPLRACDSVPSEDRPSLSSAEMLDVRTSDIDRCADIINSSMKKDIQKSSGNHNSMFATERHPLFYAETSNVATNDKFTRCNSSAKKPSSSHNTVTAQGVHNLLSAEMLDVTAVDKGRWSSHTEHTNTELNTSAGHISVVTKRPGKESFSGNVQSQGEVSLMSQTSFEHKLWSSASNNCSRENFLNIDSTTDALKFSKDVGSWHSKSSSSHSKKTTLSSLFMLDDAEDLAGASTEPDCMQNDIQREFSVTETFKISKDVVHRRSSKQRSFSERADPSKYLFPVPEDTKASSWFSSILRKMKRSPWTRSAGPMAMASEHQNGWEHARQSWDAPRPSTWEQLRFTSFEGPTTSSRPSWDGVIQFSSEDPVLNGIDFCIKGSRKVKEGLELHSSAQPWTDPKSLLVKGKIGSKTMFKEPHCKNKEDRTRPPSSTKDIQTLSAQTTPPRLSDSVEIFLQQRLNNVRHYQHYGKASLTIWSKVWAKTFSNTKWAFRSKHEKEQDMKDFDCGSERSGE